MNLTYGLIHAGPIQLFSLAKDAFRASVRSEKRWQERKNYYFFFAFFFIIFFSFSLSWFFLMERISFVVIFLTS